MKEKVLMFVSCLLLSMQMSLAQSGTIKGVVTDADDGSPIIGASVLVEGTDLGGITSGNGNFSISKVPATAKTLRVSYIGMQTRRVQINRNETMHIALVSDEAELDEVVVTAMGISRSEKTLGYSAMTVKADEIVMARTTNVANALSGKVSGVQIQSNSPDPGSANSIIIRGFSSINGNNQPMYVVDGVPLQNSVLTSQGHANSMSGISNISSEDIELMTVLKGAAATALYGSRAANGVIVITTKQGKKGDKRNFTIEYNGSVQARQVAYLPEMQNDFGQGWNGMQTYIENGSWGPKFDGSTQVYGPIWNGQQLIHEYSAKKDNVKEFFDLGWSQNHSIALSGASADDKMTYYLSYSHSDDNGIIPTDADSYQRNTFAFRNSYEAAKWLKVSSSVNFANAQTDVVGSFQGTSVIDGLYEMPRDISILDMQDLSSPFNTPEAYYTPYGITNPYWALENNLNHTDSKQIYGKLQADIKPISDLTLTYRFGFDYTDYDMKMGYPQIALDDALIEEDYGYAPSAGMNQDGYVYARYGRSYELNHDFMANYTKKFLDNKLDLNVNAGVNINERNSTYMYGQSDVLTFETGYWDLSNGANWTSLTEIQSKRRLVGLFGDVTVGWDEMLFVNLTARNDWSSTLPIGNNSFFYPGATLSWIFTKMLPENKVLTFGKVRMAYGKTGNDASPYYTSNRFTQAYAYGYFSDGLTFPLNGVNAFQSASTMGSNTLKPEMTSEFEVGLNLQFFDGRFGIDAAYYDRSTKDQIFTLPVDPSSGYYYQVTNFGEVQNRGFELLVNTTPINTRKFRWDLDFNFAINRNKVVSMPSSLEGGKVTIYSFKAGNDEIYMYAEEGKPMGTYYTKLPMRTEDGKVIVDEAGMPVINDELQDTGYDMNHKWTGGVSTSFSAYGFTLSATLDVRYGGKMFSRTKNLMEFTGNGVETTYNNRKPFVIPNSVVQNEDGSYSENTTPIYLTDGSYQDYFDTYGWGQGGEAYLVDRTFAKLRNVSLTWNLPKKWLKPLTLRSVAITAFANNLFMWTAKDNYYVDPESSTTGTDLKGSFGELYTNPSCRVFGCNLSVKF